MYGETFYGRHTAQHQLQWRHLKIKNDSFRGNENIHKKEDGSYNLALSFWLKTYSQLFGPREWFLTHQWIITGNK